MNVLGVTGEHESDIKIVRDGNPAPFIPLDKLGSEGAKYCLVSDTKLHFGYVAKKLEEAGIAEENIVCDRTVCVSGFTFEKYNLLRRSKLSIIAINCCGGMMSHCFALPFRSPFVNMNLPEEDFLKMLEGDMRSYLTGELRLKGTAYETNLKFDFPIFELNGLTINMNHYSDFEDAKNKWYSRIQRINWYNLLIMMFTDSEEALARFDDLPYAKKACVVPFPSDLPSAYSFDKRIFSEPNIPTWKICNSFGGGNVPLYDMWDLMLYGKKTRL